jgi:hypothetical protein
MESHLSQLVVIGMIRSLSAVFTSSEPLDKPCRRSWHLRVCVVVLLEDLRASLESFSEVPFVIIFPISPVNLVLELLIAYT